MTNVVTNMIPRIAEVVYNGEDSPENPVFTYNSDNVLTSISYDGGLYKTLTYDADDRLSTVVLREGSGTVLETLTLNYVNGLLASVVKT